MQTIPVSFLDEPIEARYDEPANYKKTPECPDGFVWRGEDYRVVELIAEWRDFSRKGRMARNMAPEHASRASVYGSWGVGRFTFCVRVQTGRIYEIYYDRAPKDAGHREGGWILKGERKLVSAE